MADRCERYLHRCVWIALCRAKKSDLACHLRHPADVLEQLHVLRVSHVPVGTFSHTGARASRGLRLFLEPVERDLQQFPHRFFSARFWSDWSVRAYRRLHAGRRLVHRHFWPADAWPVAGSYLPLTRGSASSCGLFRALNDLAPTIPHRLKPAPHEMRTRSK